LLVVGISPKMDSTLLRGIFLKEGRLCIPQGSIRNLLVKESHEGGLMGILELIRLLSSLRKNSFGPI